MSLELQVVVLAIAAFFLGILSGVSGGGAGMVMVPLAVALGLPPQTAVGTMKLGGLGASLGGVSVFLKSGHVRRDILRVMAPIGIFIALATPFVFQSINSTVFQIILGILLLMLAPVSLLKKASPVTSRKRRGIGYILYSGVLALQAVFGTGSGVLANYVSSYFLGATKLEANATKRVVSAVLVPIVFIGLLLTGFVSLIHGLPILVTGFLGTRLGSKVAVRKGESYVTTALFIVSLISGAWLLTSGLRSL